MSTTSWVWTIVIIIVIAVAGWWFVSQSAPAPATTNNTETGSLTGTVAAPTGAPMSAAVAYGSGGFSPAEVTIKKGGTVTWTNQGGGSLWVASAMHPAHAAYSGTTLAQHCDDATDTSFDQCKNGASYSFTFDKTGTWAYHNHSASSNFGKVIVVE